MPTPDLTVSYSLAGYRVALSSDGGITFTLVMNVLPAVTSCTDTTTTFGSAYLYRVAALDSQGNEGASSSLVPAVVPTINDAIHSVPERV